MGAAEVFVGDGAGDGGFVDAEVGGNLVHGEGTEVVGAFFEEIDLVLENFLGDG